jgi:hypothetical protein
VLLYSYYRISAHINAANTDTSFNFRPAGETRTPSDERRSERRAIGLYARLALDAGDGLTRCWRMISEPGPERGVPGQRRQESAF